MDVQLAVVYEVRVARYRRVRLRQSAKNEIRPLRAAIAIACSCVMFAAVAVMTTSAPRPQVSLRTSSTTSAVDASMR